jgi:hypothetical protein
LPRESKQHHDDRTEFTHRAGREHQPTELGLQLAGIAQDGQQRPERGRGQR